MFNKEKEVETVDLTIEQSFIDKMMIENASEEGEEDETD